jgi:predicted Zn-dependent peptidase
LTKKKIKRRPSASVRGSFRRTVLPNGIRIVSESIPSCQSISLGFFIPVGSRVESARDSGISHLLEHMVFKGTSRRTANEIAVSLESLGGHLNAFTEKETTGYDAVFLPDDLDVAVDVISDMVSNPLLAASDLITEKHVVFEEIRNLEDTPDDRVHELFMDAVFHGNPMGFCTLGNIESVDRIRCSDLVDFHRKHYTSKPFVVAAAGRLKHEDLVRRITKSFRRAPRNGQIESDTVFDATETLKKYTGPINQTHVCTGTLGFQYDSEEKFPLILLNSLLGGGMSSRLFQNIREHEGLAYSVYSFLDFWSDTGLWGVYLGTDPKTSSKALSMVDTELDRLCTNPISKTEIQRTKNQLIGNLILSSDDSTHRMNQLAKMEIYTRKFFPINDVIQQIEAVGAEDLQSVARTLFQDRKRFTVLIEPV